MRAGTKAGWYLCLAALGIMSSAAALSQTKPSGSFIPFFANSGKWQGKPHVDIFGVIQPTYTHTSDARAGKSIAGTLTGPTPQPNGSKVKDSFSFTRARVGFRGTATKSVSFFTLLEFAQNPPTGPVGGAVRLLDARINWDFSKYVNLSMGQYIPDFAQGIQPGATVAWVDYTDVEKSVWFFNRQGDTQTTALREFGASLWKEFRWGNSEATYEIGAYNGNGLQQTETTDNHKDIIASLRFAHGPWWTHAGYITGQRKVLGEAVGRKRYSATAGWGNNITDKYWIFGEYLKTNEKQPNNAPNVKSDGFYIATGWRPIHKVGLMYRYSECDCEDNIGPPGKRDSRVHTFSATYWLKGHMKILAQYDIRNESRAKSPNGNAFRVYFSVPFSYRVTK